MGNPLFTHRDDLCAAALRRSRQFRIVSRIFTKLYVRRTNYRDCLIKSVPSVNCIDLFSYANISILLICLTWETNITHNITVRSVQHINE